MKLIVGLGNPGEKYRNTRHNVGFLILDELKNQISKSQLLISNQSQNFQINNNFRAEILKIGNTILAKPQTFMNASGEAITSITSFYKVKPNDIYVIHDDLDIRLGDYKIQKGVGPKLHYGITSIDEKLGTTSYWRVRIGVDNRAPKNRILGEEYVLQNFLDDEKEIVSSVAEKVVSDLIKIIS